MAKLIEPTPVLRGKDAKALLDEVANEKFSYAKSLFFKHCVEVYNSTQR